MNVLPTLDSLLQSLTNDKVTSWLIIVILVLCVWLFKEVRTQYLEDNNKAVSRIDKAIEAYGALEVSILSYLNDECEENKKAILEKISAMYTHFQIFQHTESLSFYVLNFNRNDLENLLKIANDDLSFLVKEQKMRVHIIKGEGIISRIEYFFNTTLSSLLGPVIITVFTIYLFAFSLYVAFDVYAIDDWRDRIYIYTLSMDFVIVIRIIATTVDLLREKKLKHTVANWPILLFSFLVLIVPFIVHKWYISFASFIFYIIYLSWEKIKGREPII